MNIIGISFLFNHRPNIILQLSNRFWDDDYIYKALKSDTFECKQWQITFESELILNENNFIASPSLSFSYTTPAKFQLKRAPFSSLPLYFSIIPNQGIIYSTDIHILRKTLYRLFDIQVSYSTNFISEYLSGRYSFQPYAECTIYQDIYRLPPGHVLESKHGQISIFSDLPNKFSQEQNKSLQEFGEHFKSLFIQSIAKRLQSDTNIGAQLSGGLDSSSIVSTLYKEFNFKDIDCYFLTDRKKFFDELSTTTDNYFARKLTDEFGYKLNLIDKPLISFNQLVNTSKHLSHPITSLNITALVKNLELSQSNGNNILFSGHDGDSIVGYGYEYLNQLIDNKDWKELHFQLENWVQTDWYRDSNKSAESIKATIIVNSLIKYFKSGDLVRFGLLFIDSQKQLQIPYSRILTALYKRINRIKNNKFEYKLPKFVNPPKHNKLNSLAEFVVHYPSQIHINANMMPLEEYQQIGKHYNIRIETPYFDYQIHQLCQSAPLSFLFYNGLGRGIVREGLRNILPNYIRTRSNKTNSSDDFRLAINDNYNLLMHVSTTSDVLWNYVDRDVLVYILKKLNKGANISSPTTFKFYLQLHFMIQLKAWMDAHKI